MKYIVAGLAALIAATLLLAALAACNNDDDGDIDLKVYKVTTKPTTKTYSNPNRITRHSKSNTTRRK